MTTLDKILERCVRQVTSDNCSNKVYVEGALEEFHHLLPIITQLIEVVKLQREALKECQSICVEIECEECGTYESVRYSIKPTVEVLTTTDKLLEKIAEGE